MDAPTPCTEWTVRKLVNHLLFWGPSLTGDDWAATLLDQVDRLVEAWRNPAVWTGVTRMGGPAATVG